MILVDVLFSIANGLFLIAVYPMIRAAIKNRNSLRGFSFIGSFLTFLGMFTILLAYLRLHSYLAALLAIPTLLYWGTICWYNRSKK